MSEISGVLRIAVVAFGAIAAVVTAVPAAASPLGGSTASDAIAKLQAQGYTVNLNLNGPPNVPMYECTVTDVHGLPNADVAQGQFTNVYLDVYCPAGN